MPNREPQERCRWCTASTWMEEDYLCNGKCEDEEFQEFFHDEFEDNTTPLIPLDNDDD